MIAVLVMTDGRDDLLARTIEAWEPVLHHPLVSEWWLHDDTGDRAHIAAMERQYGVDSRTFARNAGPFMVIGGPRSGFGGAINRAWSRLMRASSARYVFHLEDDFVPVRPIYLADMVDVMDHNPHLVQMALRRQPWNDDERAAGGIVEQHPHDYADVTTGTPWTGRETHYDWLEHRRFFTTNPSLYRRSLCSRGWPTGPNSEGRFGLQLFADDPAARAAFWGRRDSGEWVEHIGHVRAGNGY